MSHQQDKPDSESLSLITVNLTPKHHHDRLLLRLWLLLQQLIIYIFNSLPSSQTVLPTKALSSHSKSRKQQLLQWKLGGSAGGGARAPKWSCNQTFAQQHDSSHWGTATQGVGFSWGLPGIREH